MTGRAELRDVAVVHAGIDRARAAAGVRERGRAALGLAGDLLNDMGGLPTTENATTCAETGAALLIMHTVGTPKVPHTHVGYADMMQSLDAFFAEKITLAEVP